MKKLIVFTIVLISNYLNTWSCGFYPFAEDIRFSLLPSEIFDLKGYANFYYSGDIFHPDDNYAINVNKDLNIVSWLKFCNQQVDTASIYSLIYKMPIDAINTSSDNKFLNFLYKNKRNDAINYIKFAKNAELLNNFTTDLWERLDDAEIVKKKRVSIIKEAEILAANSTDAFIKNRYLFLAIRLSFYNEDFNNIISLFDKNFANAQVKDITYYWSLYFRTLVEQNKTKQLYYAAQVIAYAPDKRFKTNALYDKNIATEQILKLCTNNEEKANVYVLAAINKTGYALENIEKIYEHQNNSPALNILLVRELNKIEDWILTPTYTMFNPSFNYLSSFGYGNNATLELTLQRIEKDKAYAKKVLTFLDRIKNANNPILIQSLKVNLLCILKDYKRCIDEADKLLDSKSVDEKIKSQIELIKAIALTASSKTASLDDFTKKIMLKNKSNFRFLFAVGRELEFKGNSSEAALIFSNINTYDIDADFEFNNFVYWQYQKDMKKYYYDFFYDYYNYIDIAYTPEQIQNLIDYVNLNKKKAKRDDFLEWELQNVSSTNGLYDLLGTKYIRQNKLEAALASFSKIDNNYWNNYYSLWERNNSGRNIFDANPFFDLKYTPKFIHKRNDFILTKTTVTQQLMDYIRKAENPNDSNRAYYAFLVGNCYYNMTMFGNSWMMRRFYFSNSESEGPNPEDENEFRNALLSKKYYLMAAENSNNPKFKALCYRMTNDKKILLQKYPNDYKKLTSNCTYFEEYFN